MRMRNRVINDNQKSEERRRRVQHPADWIKRANQGMIRRTTGRTKVNKNDAR